ncbi:MAG: tRNA (adenosine(37)-N6)-threonylcarbamoyltransferase complex ATPase subunit type 1 TsaE [Thermoguttaceae bacterium]|jgi:tRNA threonylcarbamoyladenosine biosynthesis protein TsaE|nr:tRNA (adenosine(37)-N6)-threonylcarbamoyltransferase complex ATPase subunit type 1 TsaE [Thermoguttaceae bacterium]
MTARLVCRVSGEEETRRLGYALADTLPPGSVVSLIGTLGAGKTALTSAVASRLGVPDGETASPTFVLIKEYTSGRIPVYHFDTYRLKDADEFYELGPDEYFDGDGLCFVEWGDRFEEVLPPDRLDILITVRGATEREFELVCRGEFPEQVLDALRGKLA